VFALSGIAAVPAQSSVNTRGRIIDFEDAGDAVRVDRQMRSFNIFR
jgi:hypothetical protein